MSKRKGRRRYKKTHKEAEPDHALAALYDRYGLCLNKSDLRDIVDLIQTGQSIFVSDGYSNARSIHIVRYRDRTMRVVYSRKNHQLVTALPLVDVSRMS